MAGDLPMATVEALLAQIQGLSSNPEDAISLLNCLSEAHDFLQAHAASLADPLLQLDPSIHSLGYLFLLEAHTSIPIFKEQANEVVLVISRFIASCSAAQIRLAPDKFITVSKRLKEQVMVLERPIQGIAPLRLAIHKLQPSTEHLTALHPDYLLLCLLAKCYKAGLNILEDEIYEVDQPKDFFLYCYYGGMIYIGHKCFRKALEFLHNAISAPMTSVDTIIVEAYKKYILVSLIQNGQVPSLPKYASSPAQRYLKTYAQSYQELVAAYGTGKISELDACLTANKDKYEADKNFGLVKQVVSSLYKRNIQRLTQTYLTLSLQDIANSVQLENSKQAEMHVLEMIQDGEIFATINQKDGMVSFLEDPEQYKSCEMIEHIDASIQRLMGLTKKLCAMEEHISYDSLYLAKVGRERSKFELDDIDSAPQKFL